MAQLNPYLNFDNNCREAMTFYKDCFGGELSIQTIEGSPMEAECPAAMKHQVLHATLTSGPFILMGSDMAGPEGFTKGNTIALSVSCGSAEEINNFFSKLSAEGQITHPLADKFWGATFGVVTDKFGIRWMLNYDKHQAA